MYPVLWFSRLTSRGSLFNKKTSYFYRFITVLSVMLLIMGIVFGIPLIITSIFHNKLYTVISILLGVTVVIAGLIAIDE